MDDIQKLEQLAINAAIKIRWQDAIAFNKKVIEADKHNVDGYLRLAYALLQSNKIADAKKQYKKALKLKPGNQTILDSLERIKILESRKTKLRPEKKLELNPTLFLETPGKTKSIVVVNPGQKNVLASLSIGQRINLIPKKRRIEVRAESKEYIGSLPDDISKRLTILIKAGSVFSALIKEASLSKVVVFVNEEKKGRKVMKYTSFPTSMQNKLEEINQSQDDSSKDEDSEELHEGDLEHLAESLATEEKEYIPIDSEESDDESEE